ncbi:MAG: hypothetical protein WDZ73_00515 [Candidatus Paceibacterota bacterium]
MPNRKSLREILPKSATKRRVKAPTINNDLETETEEEHPDYPEADQFLKQRQSRVPKKIIWIGGTILILFLIFLGSSFFTSVKAIIVPKQAKITIDNSVIALSSDLAQTAAATSTELIFETIAKEVTREVTLPATGSENVSKKASGQIAIFNDFSSEDQLLVTNTRFETPDNLIYRISEPVTVPGQVEQNGQTIPGQVVVTVTAEEAGNSYNLENSDFTIPGFEGTPRFEGFYARTITPIAGGFVGPMKTVAENDKLKAESTLKAELEALKLDSSELEIPETHIALPGGILSTFSTSQKSGEGDNVVITGKLEVSALVFEKSKLASYLADRYVSDYNNEPVKLKSYDSVQLALLKEEGDTINLNSVEIDLKGNAHIIWIIDENNLKNVIAGKTKNSYTLAIADFPSILGIQLKFMPPWASTIPINPNKITIIEKLDE